MFLILVILINVPQTFTTLVRIKEGQLRMFIEMVDICFPVPGCLLSYLLTILFCLQWLLWLPTSLAESSENLISWAWHSNPVFSQGSGEEFYFSLQVNMCMENTILSSFVYLIWRSSWVPGVVATKIVQKEVWVIHCGIGRDHFSSRS